MAKIDPKSKYPIIRSVTKIIRQKAPDLDDKYQRPKEYITARENWTGKDYLGRPIPHVTDHLVGISPGRNV